MVCVVARVERRWTRSGVTPGKGRAAVRVRWLLIVLLMGVVEEDVSRRKTLGGGFEEEPESGRFFGGIVDAGRGERELSWV